MDLKVRFSILFSLLLALLLGAFSIVVYSGFRKQLLSSANQTLLAHLAHEWDHLQQLPDPKSYASSTLKTGHVFHRVLRNGEPFFSSFPTRAAAPSFEGKQLVLADKIIYQTKRELRNETFVMVGVYDLKPTLENLSALTRVLTIVCILAVLLAIPLAFGFARHLLKPFRLLSHKTSELSAERLSFRFPPPRNRDEFGLLVINFNSLLDRLEKSFQQLRRFASNASHELRTPLTVIRSEAEVTLRREREPCDYQSALSQIVRQAESLQRIISRLLFFADLERVGVERQSALVPVEKVVSETVATLEKAYGKGRVVDLDAKAGLSIRLQPDLFSSILTNLLENAFKYAKSRIRVRWKRESAGLQLEIEDDGPGIPEDKQEHLFEPFFKVPPPQTEKPQGHGLGLSIVKACLEACRGEIRFQRSPLGGLGVLVTLPESA